MRIIQALAAGLIGLGLGAAAPAAAQVFEAEEVTVVEALVVNARLPGPAWWVIEDADTKIYVLGVPAVTPKGLAWDQSVLDRRLDGAFGLITPPVGRAGIRDLPGLLLLTRKLKSAEPLADTLPPAMRPRLESAVRKAGERPDDYARLKPLVAALKLEADFRRAFDLRTGAVASEAEKLARRHKVKPRPAAEYRAMPAIKQLINGDSRALGVACLIEAIGEVEAGVRPPRDAAAAWARGEVTAALGPEPDAPSACQAQLRRTAAGGRLAELAERARADQLAAFLRALDTPGHAVAILPLRSVVATDGVLDQLRARGVTVRTPGD